MSCIRLFCRAVECGRNFKVVFVFPSVVMQNSPRNIEWTNINLYPPVHYSLELSCIEIVYSNYCLQLLTPSSFPLCKLTTVTVFTNKIILLFPLAVSHCALPAQCYFTIADCSFTTATWQQCQQRVVVNANGNDAVRRSLQLFKRLLLRLRLRLA